VYLTTEGLIVVRENSLVRQLASRLRRYPQLDPPKYAGGLQVTIGFFNTSPPFATEEEARFEAALTQLIDILVGRMMVEQVWLVHYANRTLNQIVGKVPFTLGGPSVRTTEHLLQELYLATFQLTSGT
jgi:hypothetical protein